MDLEHFTSDFFYLLCCCTLLFNSCTQRSKNEAEEESQQSKASTAHYDKHFLQGLDTHLAGTWTTLLDDTTLLFSLEQTIPLPNTVPHDSVVANLRVRGIAYPLTGVATFIDGQFMLEMKDSSGVAFTIRTDTAATSAPALVFYKEDSLYAPLIPLPIEADNAYTGTWKSEGNHTTLKVMPDNACTLYVKSERKTISGSWVVQNNHLRCEWLHPAGRYGATTRLRLAHGKLVNIANGSVEFF